MLDEVATAIATGAAGNIVAYMLNGRVDALRAQVARMFRHGTEHEQALALRTLEDDVVAVNYRASETALVGRWTNVLLAYLAAHPEARGDIEAFAAPSGFNRSVSIGSQHNHGSGTFIGGDNYGNLNSGH